MQSPCRIPRPPAGAIALGVAVGCAGVALGLLAGLGWWSAGIGLLLGAAPLLAAGTVVRPLLTDEFEDLLAGRDALERRLGSALEVARRHVDAEALHLVVDRSPFDLSVTAERGHDPRTDRAAAPPPFAHGRPHSVRVADAGTLVSWGGRGAAAQLGPLASRLAAVLHAARLGRDAEGLRMRVDELEAVTATDSLTGLATREVLVASLEEALDEADAHVGVVFVDLDRFKRVNDRHGHLRGDQLLATVADRLRGAVKRDDVVARMGGDEFAILVRSADEAETLDVAERVVASIRLPYDLGNESVSIGASAGVVVGEPRTTRSVTELLDRADEAMYVAKRAGGGVRSAAEEIVITIPDETATAG